MADQDLVFKLRFEGGDVAARETGKVTEKVKQLDKAQKQQTVTSGQLADQSKNVAGKFGNIASATGPLASQLGRLNGTAGRLGGAFASMGGAVTGLTSGFGAFGLAIGATTVGVGLLTSELAAQRQRMEDYRKTITQTVRSLQDFISRAREAAGARALERRLATGTATVAEAEGGIQQTKQALSLARQRRRAIGAIQKLRRAGGDISVLTAREYTDLRQIAGTVEGSGGRVTALLRQGGVGGDAGQLDREIARLEQELAQRRRGLVFAAQAEAEPQEIARQQQATRGAAGGGRGGGGGARAAQERIRRERDAEKERITQLARQEADIRQQYQEQQLADQIRNAEKENEVFEGRIQAEELLTQQTRDAAEAWRDSWTGSLSEIAEAFETHNRAMQRLGKQTLETTELMRVSVNKTSSDIADLVGGEMTRAVDTHVRAWVSGEENIGKAVQGILTATLQGIAQEAAVQAIFELAKGVATSFVNPAEAATHFAAAGLYGAVAAAAGAGGAAIGGGGGGRASAAGAGAGATTPAGYGTPARTGGGEDGPAPTVIINVTGLMSEADTGRTIADALGAAKKQYGPGVIAKAGLGKAA